MPVIFSKSRRRPSLSSAGELISKEAGRLLLLDGCLLTTRIANASPKSTTEVIHRLGFLQLDSIFSVERAHHLILHARLDGFEPPMLARVAEKNRAVFEHWTHDASMIRSDWRRYWSHRFETARERLHKSEWFKGQLGRDGKQRIDEVRQAIRDRGPLMARDFPRPARAAAGWWDWSPQKAALEYLWRTGEVAIQGRLRFDKIYNLAERVHATSVDSPTREALVHWACSEALQRLGAATARELVHFMHAITIAEAKVWCATAIRNGDAVPVSLERETSKRIEGVARVDWRRRVGQARPSLPARLLAPFDPLIRDRRRALALFDFDYRFEAFVPAPKRRYGYYTMPVLANNRLVARVDLASDREALVLRVARAWKESGIGVRDARRHMRDACERLAEQLGFRVEIPKSFS